MTLAACIYAEALSYRGHGLALWIPEPSKSGQVQIGDVGYVDKGGFYRLFNVTYLANDPINKDGVPPDFEVLNITQQHKHERENYLPPGPLCSRSVREVVVGCNGSSKAIVAEAGYRFKCSEDSGALLVLKDYATLEEVHQGHVLEKYIRKHHANWCFYARDICGLSVDPEDIMLVKGCVKTSEWVVAAFLEKGTEHEVSLHVGAEPYAKANISVSVSSSTSMSVEYRFGPLQHTTTQSAPSDQSPNLSRVRDQTVFISGYRLRRRFVLPSKLLAAAGREVDGEPRPDGVGVVVTGSDEDENDSALDVYEYPSAPKFRDPVDDILDYILETSDADVAIASHPCSRESALTDNADTESCHLAALLKSGHHVVVDETNMGTFRSAPGIQSLLNQATSSTLAAIDEDMNPNARNPDIESSDGAASGPTTDVSLASDAAGGMTTSAAMLVDFKSCADASHANELLRGDQLSVNCEVIQDTCHIESLRNPPPDLFPPSIGTSGKGRMVTDQDFPQLLGHTREGRLPSDVPPHSALQSSRGGTYSPADNESVTVFAAADERYTQLIEQALSGSGSSTRLNALDPSMKQTWSTSDLLAGSSQTKQEDGEGSPTVCINCSTANTPLWMRDPEGQPLCNACGLFYKYHGVVRPLSVKTDVIKKRNRPSGTPHSASRKSNSALSRLAASSTRPGSSTTTGVPEALTAFRFSPTGRVGGSTAGSLAMKRQRRTSTDAQMLPPTSRKDSGDVGGV